MHNQDFENFAARPGSFRLIFAATSWHWIDPAVRYRRAHELLQAGGHLAFWSALHAFPAGFDPFFTEIGAVYSEIGFDRPGEWPPPTPEQIADDSDEIIGSGLFDDVQVRRYVWERFYTAEELIALLSTFSSHIAMSADKREHLFRWIRQHVSARPGQRVHRHWYAILHVAHAS